MTLFFNQAWAVRLGWTLLHFLWQGTLIAIVLAVARGLLAKSMTAHARYVMACAALVALTMAPVLTYFTVGDVHVKLASAAVWQVVPADAWQRALPWLVLVWLGGVVVFSARLIGGWRLASRMQSMAVRPAPKEWQRTMEELVRTIGAWRPMQLLISSLVEVPTVVGWLRPVILMPVGALTGLPPEHVAALLAHELAHIRRHDYLANILQSVAEAVLFYHPAVWWVSNQIRAERELCCDDLAVAASGGDVLMYARALASVEGFRPAHAEAVLAANGGSLVSRIRRLIGQAPSVSQSLPGPGAVLSLALLWMVGIGAATVHASSQAFVPQADSSVVMASPLTPPALSALLFDPFFEPPQVVAPGPAKAPVQAPEPAPIQSPNQHGHRVDLKAAFLADIDMPMTFADATTIPLKLPGMPQRADPNARLRVLIAKLGAPVQLISPADAVTFETWMEDASAQYAESFQAGSGDIERGTRWITIPRFVREDLRHIYVKYSVTVELILPARPQVPRAATYQVTLADTSAEIPWPNGLPAGSKVVSPARYPAPQNLEEDGVVAVELSRDPKTGQKLIDYIHVGRLNQITLRTEAPHDSYAADAEFRLAQPWLNLNGEPQESAELPETLRGPAMWFYAPGYGRYVASFKPRPELGFDRIGELSGNRLTFAEGADIIQIESKERIAAGSGSYRVHLLSDPSWMPADPKERDRAMIGVLPGFL